MDGSMVESKRMWENILYKNTQLAIQAFERMWEEARKQGARESMRRFQKLCQDVKTWSDHMMREHTNLITSKCDYFRDLVACAITANAKVLCIIKLRKNPEKVNVPVPTNEAFLHSLMTNMAEMFYNEPWIMQDKDEANRQKVMRRILKESLEEAIYQHLPKREILVANVGTGIEEDVGEEADPEESVENVEAFEEKPPLSKDEEEPVDEMENEEEDENTLKTIEADSPEPKEEENESLFPGAKTTENFNE